MPIEYWRFNGTVMKKILIVVKDQYPATIKFHQINPEENVGQEISVITIQKGKILPDSAYKKVLVLETSLKEPMVDPIMPTISYQDFLEEIFSADTVMVL
jgi:hypothetical protein